MKVLHLNTFDIAGGAARAAWRLHQGLLAQGLDSLMLVQTRNSSDPSVLEHDSRWSRWLGRLRPYAEILPLLPYRGRPGTHWATEWLPSRVLPRIRELKPDIIHLHWVCRGFLSLREIGELDSLSGAAVVWTLHDSWPFTGGCHVPGSCERYRNRCGACPQLASHRDEDLSRMIWMRKQKYWAGLSLRIVAPSAWLGECVRRSRLFSDHPVTVIPNGIDTRIYAPVARASARRQLGLPSDRKLILLSAMNATLDSNKGFPGLAAALRALASSGKAAPVELVIAGQARPSGPIEAGVPVHFLGVLEDDASMVAAYSAADVTVMPSLQENLPNAIVESMACGTPVVAFGIGGVPQLIEQGVSGLIARPQDSEDLAGQLIRILENDAERQAMGAAARLKIEHEFSTPHVTELYRNLYEKLLR